MKQKFKLDSRGGKMFIGIVFVCSLLALIPMSLSGTLSKLAVYFIPGILLLIILWLAVKNGSYITIDQNKNVYGTVCFIPGRTTSLTNVTSLISRKAFLGIYTEIYMTYRNNKGDIEDRGLVTKESMQQNDLKKLIETISVANPNIDIPEKLYN